MTVKIGRRGLLMGAVAALTLPGGARAEAPPQIKVVSRTLDVLGKPAKVFGIAGPGGKPGVDMVLGERFKFNLVNQSGEATLIHWHGLKPPIEQDGVPGLSRAVLADGAAQTYDFANTRAGTHWMHSHVGLQEQRLMAAPLIVHETAEPVFDEQEHVVMLHDFSFRDPADILAELRAGGGAHGGHAGMDNMDQSKMTMDMSAAMLNDVVFDAYLCNDRTLDDPEIVAVDKGGIVRLRIVNGAAASNMWIDLGLLEGELIAVDGNAIYPRRGSLFPLAIAQRADIRLQVPKDGGAFPVLFRPEGVTQRTGLVLATPGAAIGRMAGLTEAAAPALDLAFEADLKAVGKLADEPLTRTETLMLTGGGADYSWGLNGKSSMHDTLFTVRPGERIAVIIHNMTAMAHPMHLHGHYFKVVAVGDKRIDGALRDTILVPPTQRVTIEFDADNPGSWAFHCHHIYHMNAGMMGVMSYMSAA